MERPVYLDCHATTPVDPRVLEAMLPFFRERFGNAASRTHAFGWEGHRAVEEARERVARGLGGRPREVVFTSGATESNNLAILGAARAYEARGRRVVTVATEHKAVLDPVRHLADEGFEVTVLPVGEDGILDLERLREAVVPGTILVSVMLANNEIGVLQRLDEIAAVAHKAGSLVHTDAAQAVGKIPVDVENLGVDLLSLSGHKLYGPKGVGALWIRGRDPRVRLAPLVYGGGHERGLRSGTPNVPGVVGLGRAVEIACDALDEEAPRIRALRDRLHRGITNALDGVLLNGHPERRLPGNLNLSFRGVPGESLVAELRDLAVSTGSACTSADPTPSHVLAALGRDPEDVHASLRFGIGRFNTEAEIDFAVGEVVAAVRRLREVFPGA